MSQHASDEDLIRQYLAGRGEALATLIVRHREYAYRLCYRMLLHHHEAEEAAQEALVRAVEGLRRFRGDAPFRAWLTRILVRECLGRRRAAKRRGPLLTLADDPAAGDPRTAGVELTELQAKVRDAIGELPVKQRMTLVLRVYESLGFDQIAELLGTTPAAARVNLFLARRRLRELLEPFMAEDGR